MRSFNADSLNLFSELARAVTATSAEIHAQCGQERTLLKRNLSKTQRDGRQRMANLRTTNQEVCQGSLGNHRPTARPARQDQPKKSASEVKAAVRKWVRVGQPPFHSSAKNFGTLL